MNFKLIAVFLISAFSIQLLQAQSTLMDNPAQTLPLIPMKGCQ